MYVLAYKGYPVKNQFVEFAHHPARICLGWLMLFEDKVKRRLHAARVSCKQLKSFPGSLQGCNLHPSAQIVKR